MDGPRETEVELGVVRVVVADDHMLAREVLASLLRDAPRIRLVGVCVDAGSLRTVVEDERPDVVVTDIRMPPDYQDEGIQIAHRLREAHPDIGVVVLSQYDDAEYALALLQARPQRRAYLLKGRIRDRAELLAAIEAVARGDSYIDSRVVERLIEVRRRAVSPLDELTASERETLALIAQGLSDTAIANQLDLPKRAVEKHVHMIFFKLLPTGTTEISKRVKAALIYLADQSPAP